MSDEEEAVIDGSGYTGSGEGSAGRANWPGGPWAITWRVNACGMPWLEEPVTVRNDGLKVAAGAISVTLS